MSQAPERPLPAAPGTPDPDPSSRARRLWDRLAPLSVLGIFLYTLYPLLLGPMPVSHDHPVHLFKAWQFYEALLSEGHLFGWSHSWFFGYPPGALYPLLPDLWVAAFRALTLESLSWEHTYGLALTAAMGVCTWALYALTRQLFGTTAAFLAAVFFTLDPGGWQQGGWIYTVRIGVWAQPFAMAWLFLALAQMDRLRQGHRGAAVLLAPLYMGLALLGHPMTVLLGAILLPLFVLSRGIARRPALLTTLRGALYSLALGSLMAGIWLLPFIARRGYALNIGVPGRTGALILEGLYTGALFLGGWQALVYAAWAGLAFGIWRRRPGALLMGLSWLILVGMASEPGRQGLVWLYADFSNLQSERLLIPAKAFAFGLSGYGIAALGGLLWRWGRERGRGRIPAILAFGLLVCATSTMILEDLWEAGDRRDALPVSGEVGHWAEDQRLMAWIRDARAQSPDFFRVATLLGTHQHRLMSGPVYTGVPFYKVGYTPCKLFRYAPESAYPPLLTALSVKYLITNLPQTSPLVQEVARFGDLYVHAFRDYRPERYTLLGEGEVGVETFGDRRIALKVSGTAPGARLRLHVSNFDRWEARVNGEIVPIKEAIVHIPEPMPMLMEIPISDGEVEFRWVSRPVDHAGAGASLLGLVLIVALPLWERRRAGRHQNPAPG